MKAVYVTLFSVCGFVITALIDPNSAVAWYAAGILFAALGLFCAWLFRPADPLIQRGVSEHLHTQLPQSGITADVPGIPRSFVLGCPASYGGAADECICKPGFGHRANELCGNCHEGKPIGKVWIRADSDHLFVCSVCAEKFSALGNEILSL